MRSKTMRCPYLNALLVLWVVCATAPGPAHRPHSAWANSPGQKLQILAFGSLQGEIEECG
ncbi:MAG: hypothetical protein R3E97_07045 [Candidatus Eisenbacteria bacterium]